MKKIMKAAWIFAVSALVLSSCAEEQNLDSQAESADMITVDITAGSVQTRTHYDGTPQIKWDSNKEYLRIIENAIGTENPITLSFTKSGVTEAGGLTARFKASLKAVNGAESFQYFAYNSTSFANPGPTMNLASFPFKLKAGQNPKASSFDPSADMLIAEGVESATQATELNFNFHRPIAVFEMTLAGIPAGDEITEVEISSTSSILAGELLYDLTTGKVVEYGTSGEKEHAITCRYPYDPIVATGSDKIYFTAFATGANNPALSNLAVIVKTDKASYRRIINFETAKTIKANSLVKLTIGDIKPIPTYVTTALSAEEMQTEGITFNRNDDWYAGEQTNYIAEQGYELTYTVQGSEEVISFDLAEMYDSYKVIGMKEDPMFGMKEVVLSETDKESFWLTLNTPIPTNPQNVTIAMDPAALGNYMPEGIIVFYGANPELALAAIYCKYDAPIEPENPSELVTVDDPTASVIALTSDNELYKLLNESNDYKTTTVYEVKTNNLGSWAFNINYAGTLGMDGVKLLNSSDLTEYKGTLTAESGIEGDMMGEAVSSYISIYSSLEDATQQLSDDLVFFIKAENGATAAVHFIYDTEFAGLEVPPPFEFADPSSTGGATLERLTGKELEDLKNEFSGNGMYVPDYYIYKLTYESEWGGTLVAPGEPSYPEYPVPEGEQLPDGQQPKEWIQWEWDTMNNTLDISMSEIGKTGRLIWSENFMPKYVLVCTRTK